MNDIPLMTIVNGLYNLPKFLPGIILRHSLNVYQVLWNGVLEYNQIFRNAES